MKKKIEKKKKIREFGYVDLFETSCCGLPSYVDAHKSFSLVKSLGKLFPDLVSDELNFKEKNPMVDENQTEDASNPEGTEDSKDSEADKAEGKEGSEESKESKDSEADKAEGKEGSEDKAASFSPKVMTEMMAKAISDGIAKGMAAIQTNPGLIDKSPAEKQKELLKRASIGELAANVFGMDKII